MVTPSVDDFKCASTLGKDFAQKEKVICQRNVPITNELLNFFSKCVSAVAAD